MVRGFGFCVAVIAFLFVFVAPAFAEVIHDSTSGQTCGSGCSAINFNHTLAAGENSMVVLSCTAYTDNSGIFSDGPDANGVEMTNIGSNTGGIVSGQGMPATQIWAITGLTPGIIAITATPTYTSRPVLCTADSFFGVATSSITSDSLRSNSDPSIAVTQSSIAGDLVYGSLGQWYSSGNPSDPTDASWLTRTDSRVTDEGGYYSRLTSAYFLATSTSSTVQYAANRYQTLVAVVIPAFVEPPPPPLPDPLIRYATSTCETIDDIQTCAFQYIPELSTKDYILMFSWILFSVSFIPLGFFLKRNRESLDYNVK